MYSPVYPELYLQSSPTTKSKPSSPSSSHLNSSCSAAKRRAASYDPDLGASWTTETSAALHLTQRRSQELHLVWARQLAEREEQLGSKATSKVGGPGTRKYANLLRQQQDERMAREAMMMVPFDDMDNDNDMNNNIVAVPDRTISSFAGRSFSATDQEAVMACAAYAIKSGDIVTSQDYRKQIGFYRGDALQLYDMLRRDPSDWAQYDTNTNMWIFMHNCVLRALKCTSFWRGWMGPTSRRQLETLYLEVFEGVGVPLERYTSASQALRSNGRRMNPPLVIS
eukprot:PhM_4_TR5382/c0_g1_i1/m.11394